MVVLELYRLAKIYKKKHFVLSSMKNLIRNGIVFLGFLFLVSPAFVLAQSTNSVQSEIAALLAELQQLQAQIVQLQGQSGSISSSSCINLSDNLYAGETDAQTGGEVTQLQQFLGVNPTTGYFGPLTLQAVQNWQSSHGVVSSGTADTTGYGFVGPRTIAAMACGTVTSNATPSNTQILPPQNNTTSIQNSTYTETNPVIINSFGASSYTVNAGQSVTFSWISNLTSNDISQNGGGCQLNNGTPAVGTDIDYGGASGSFTYSPSASATYTLQCYSGGKDGSPTATKQVTVTVIPSTSGPTLPLPVINSFSVSPTSVTQGQPVTFNWSTNWFNNSAVASALQQTGGGCFLSGSIVNGAYLLYPTSVAPGGSYAFTPTGSGTYTLECDSTGKGDGSPKAAQQVSVTVNSASTQTNPVVINSFSVSPTSVTTGQSVTFSWSSNLTSNDISQNGGGCYVLSPTNNSSELNAVGNSTNYGPSGSFTYTPTATATYTLECLSGGKDGSPTATAQATVNVTSSTQITSQNYGLPNTPFSVSGSTSINNSLEIVLVSQSYTGPTDWNDVSNLLKSSAAYTAVGVSASVSNGNWSATFQSGLPEDSYNVYVYNNANYNLVAQGVFYSTYKG